MDFGTFTLIILTDSSKYIFGKIPEGTVYSLLKPENKKILTAVLTYHVVAGKFDAKAVVKAIKANNGKFVIYFHDWYDPYGFLRISI